MIYSFLQGYTLTSKILGFIILLFKKLPRKEEVHVSRKRLVGVFRGSDPVDPGECHRQSVVCALLLLALTGQRWARSSQHRTSVSVGCAHVFLRHLVACRSSDSEMDESGCVIEIRSNSHSSTCSFKNKNKKQKNLTDLFLIKQENTVFTLYCWYKPLF